MTQFKGYYERSIFTESPLTEIGIIKLDDMGSLPFFAVHFKGKQVPRKSDEKCTAGNAKGDCYIHVHTYLDIQWINAH